MTNKEIIKALECHTSQRCADCPYEKGLIEPCFGQVMKDALDLINRQQAEIDRLKNDIFCISNERDAWKDTVNTTAAEAIKKYAEKLKEKGCELEETGGFLLETDDIDNLVKEMVEKNF